MKLNGIDLNKLNVFCAVIKYGGYTRAAEELNLSKAAISQSITALESHLGKKLFHRGGRSLKPTEEALRFHTDLNPFERSLQTAVYNLLGQDELIQGELCIGAYLEFTKSKLMPVIDSFLRKYERVSLRFRFESPSRLDQLLRDHRLDLSLSIRRTQGPKDLCSKSLFSEELVLIAHRRFKVQKDLKQQLKSMPVIDYYPGHMLFQRWWAHAYERELYEPHVRIFAASAEMLAEMVKRDLGIGVVPRYVAETYKNLGDIVIVPSKNSGGLQDHIWLNYWNFSGQSKVTHLFLQDLMSFF